MGLDMYLSGKKYQYHSSFAPGGSRIERQKEDGFEVKETIRMLELGYWRKHPNLHGFIVNTFAEGVDECQEIELSGADIEKIIDAVKAKELPPTKGFFFGESDGTETTEDLQIFGRALEWVKTADMAHDKTVIYRASW